MPVSRSMYTTGRNEEDLTRSFMENLVRVRVRVRAGVRVGVRVGVRAGVRE